MGERIDQIKKYLVQCAIMRQEPLLGTADCKYLVDRIAELDARWSDIVKVEAQAEKLRNAAWGYEAEEQTNE